MESINIIVIGSEGAGKSTFCNVVTGRTLFPEGDDSVSVTRANHCEEVQVEGLKIRIVDTIGLGGVNVTETALLRAHAQACISNLGGRINQVFFLVSERVTPNYVKQLQQIQETIFNPTIRSFTTVVRTNFQRFKDPMVTDADITSLRQAPSILPMFSMIKKMIYVDNAGKSSTREDSATILRTYIKMCSHESYTGMIKPDPISFADRDQKLKEEKEAAERELARKKKEQEDAKRRQQEEYQRLQQKIAEDNRRAEAERERLRREMEALPKLRDTGNQVRDYVVHSAATGFYIKLRGSGSFEVSGEALKIHRGNWEAWQQSAPFPGGFETLQGTVLDLVSNCNLTLHGGCTYRNITVGGNLTIC